MAEWLKPFARSVLELLPAAERPAAIEQIVALLKPVLCDREGNWTADYVRLRFLARRPCSRRRPAPAREDRPARPPQEKRDPCCCQFYFAAVLLYDSPAYPQAEAGPQFPFGGEEGLEELG